MSVIASMVASPVKVLALLLLLVAGVASAQRCLPELQGDIPAWSLDDTATGRDAAVFVKRAVDLLEPALPQLVVPAYDALPADDADAEVVSFLAERQLLPASWQAEGLEAATWREMLTTLAGWYGLTPAPNSADPLTKEHLVTDLAALIGQVAPQLRPVALIATDHSNRNRVTFWAIVRNNSVYPRLVIVAPPVGELDLQGNLDNALTTLGNCALPLRNYITAPADTATRLFVANNDTRMVIVRSDPPSRPELQYVPVGEETDYLGFDAAALVGLERYATVFVGAGPGPFAIMRLLPQIRTNMSPQEIINFVTN